MPLPAALLAAAPYMLGGLGGLAAGSAITGLGSSRPGTLSGSLSGTQGKFQQVPRFQPQQQQAINQLLQTGLGGLGSLQSLDFAPIEQYSRNQFMQQTVPGLAERFTSLGSGSSLSSPAFASQLGQAGSGLESSLAALRSQFGLQSRALDQNMLQSLLQLGLTPQFEQTYLPGTPGLLGPILGGLGQGIGSFGSYGLARLLGGL